MVYVGRRMFRNILVVVLLGVAVAMVAAGADAAWDRRPLTAEEGQQVAEAALAYAEVTYSVGDEEQQGVAYAWGGRATVQQFLASVSGYEGGGEPPADDAAPVGVDASGLVVNALRSLNAGIRFAASPGDKPVLLADANSSSLYAYNVTPVEPEQVRPGDLLFFGRRSDEEEGSTVSVTGVAVITRQEGERVYFVTASQRQGRVVHTFARIGGDYWRDNIVGAGRFLYGPAEAASR